MNLKFYDFCAGVLADATDNKLVDIGDCGLHILHNAFKNAFSAPNWELDNCFKSFYRIFKDSPVRRDDFIAITETSMFPIKFCVHRWVENIPVCRRAIENS